VQWAEFRTNVRKTCGTTFWQACRQAREVNDYVGYVGVEKNLRSECVYGPAFPKVNTFWKRVLCTLNGGSLYDGKRALSWAHDGGLLTASICTVTTNCLIATPKIIILIPGCGVGGSHFPSTNFKEQVLSLKAERSLPGQESVRFYDTWKFTVCRWNPIKRWLNSIQKFTLQYLRPIAILFSHLCLVSLSSIFLRSAYATCFMDLCTSS